VPEQPHNNAPVPDPLLQEQALLDHTLAQAAEFWAPGPASAAWENWPNDAEPQPDIAVPGLVRIGTRAGQPMLTPLLGEKHLVIGNPALLTPARLRKVQTKEVALVKKLKADAAEEYRVKEATRRHHLENERALAISVSQNVITRSIASMPPGTVDLTVVDSRDRGQAFRGFAPMGQAGRFRVTPPERVPELMRSLDEQIIALNSGGLGGYSTLRSQIRHEGTGAYPWRIVVLLGYNEMLTLTDSDRLRNIMQQGTAAGISMIVHGFETPNTPEVNRLGWADGRQVRTSVTNGWRFRLDPTVPETITRQVALRAAQQLEGPLRASVPIRPPRSLDMAADPRLVPLPGANYEALLGRRADARRAATETMRTLEREHPLFTGEALTGLGVSAENYPAFANLAARDPALARYRLSHPDVEGGMPQLAALESWAMLQLLSRTPGHTRDWLAQASRSAHAPGPEHNPGLLIDAVRITRWHGQHLIPERARDYVLQYVGEDPPAYAFQLVADLGDAARNILAVKPFAKEARDATLYHLEQTYAVRLRDDEGRVDSRLVDALTECEILRLYDFQNATPELRILLAQRAHERFAAITADELPPEAHKLYAACQTFLQERGGPLLSQTQKAGRAAGELAARTAAGALSWAKGLASKKDGGEPPQAGSGQTQIGQTQAE
jgi:hypothetical protein